VDLDFLLTVLAAGFGAGFVLTAVGAGSLVSFPLLLSAGLTPLVANVCNNVGLIPGGVTGSFGFRRELRGHRRLITQVATTSAAGGLVGAALLLALPSSAFDRVVPVLVLVSATLVGVGPFLSRWSRRRALLHGIVRSEREHLGPSLTTLSSLIGVYGGYFGAAQGVLLVAFLTLGLDVPLQTVNGLKNVAVLSANVSAGVVFVLFAPLRWDVVLLVAVGSVGGAWIGAHIGRRLPPTVFRVLVVLVGYVVGLRLLLT
jgi:uncharacterized membrane protein YfcA